MAKYSYNRMPQYLSLSLINDTGEKRGWEDLFDPATADFEARRKVRDRKPAQYLEKIDNLSRMTTKELVRELRKRKAV
jgi:hypothetical protein